MPVAILTESLDGMPHGLQARRKSHGAHYVPDLAGPESRQRLVVSAILGIRRAYTGIEVHDSGTREVQGFFL